MPQGAAIGLCVRTGEFVIAAVDLGATSWASAGLLIQ
ncbi:hypothetical protein K883_04918 [Mycobacterium sp. TKK-01-0059]|nr:hypothetical protein K883_04918 [Mycobacterium sp. TKK-01-0059]